LERSWAVLERSWTPSCGNMIFGCVDFGAVLGAQGGAKWSPSWSQNGPKSKTKKTMQQESLQDLLGDVLEPSWSALWAILAELEGDLRAARGGEIIAFPCVSFSINITFLHQDGRHEASWRPLGASWGTGRPLGSILAHLGRPRRTKREAKTSRKSVQNDGETPRIARCRTAASILLRKLRSF